MAVGKQREPVSSGAPVAIRGRIISWEYIGVWSRKTCQNLSPRFKQRAERPACPDTASWRKSPRYPPGWSLRSKLAEPSAGP